MKSAGRSLIAWTDGHAVFLSSAPAATSGGDTKSQPAASGDADPGVLTVLHRSTGATEFVHSFVVTAGRSRADFGEWSWVVAVVTEFSHVKATADAVAARTAAVAAANAKGVTADPPTFQLYVYIVSTAVSFVTAPAVRLFGRAVLDHVPTPEPVKGCVWNRVAQTSAGADVLAIWTPARLSLYEFGSHALAPGAPAPTPYKLAPVKLTPAAVIAFNSSAPNAATSATSSFCGVISAACFGESTTDGSIEVGVCTSGAQFQTFHFPAKANGKTDWTHFPSSQLLYGLECGAGGSGKVISLHSIVRSERQYWLAVSEAGIQFVDSTLKDITRIDRIGAHSRFGAAPTKRDPDETATRSFFSSAPVSMFSLTAPPPLNMVYDSRWTAPRGSSANAATTAAAAAASAASTPVVGQSSDDVPSAADALRHKLWREMTAHQTQPSTMPVLPPKPSQLAPSLNSVTVNSVTARSAPSDAAASLPSLFDIHQPAAASVATAVTGANKSLISVLPESKLATAARIISLLDDDFGGSAVGSDLKSSGGLSVASTATQTAAGGSGAQILVFASTTAPATASKAAHTTARFVSQFDVNSATAPPASHIQPSYAVFESPAGTLAIGSYVSSRVLLFDVRAAPASAATDGLSVAYRADVTAAACATASVRSGLRGLALSVASTRLHALIGDREPAKGGFGLVSLSSYPELSALRLLQYRVAADPAPAPVASVRVRVENKSLPPPSPAALVSVPAAMAGAPVGSIGVGVVNDVWSLSMLLNQQQLTINSQAETIRSLQQWMLQLSQRVHHLETAAASTSASAANDKL